jgi:hypothetical protein
MTVFFLHNRVIYRILVVIVVLVIVIAESRMIKLIN